MINAFNPGNYQRFLEENILDTYTGKYQDSLFPVAELAAFF